VALNPFNADAMYVIGYAHSSTMNYLNTQTDRDIFIHSVDTSSGDSNWIKYWGGSGDDFGNTVSVSPEGGRILVGGS